MASDTVARALALAALNGGGGGDIPSSQKVPASTAADAGKVLVVGESGTREWHEVFTLTGTTLDIDVPVASGALGNGRSLRDVPVIRFINNEEPEVDEPSEEPTDDLEENEEEEPEVNQDIEPEEPEAEEPIEENEEEAPEEE